MNISTKLIFLSGVFISLSTAQEILAKCPETGAIIMVCIKYDIPFDYKKNIDARLGLSEFEHSKNGREYLENRASLGDVHALEQLLYAASGNELGFNKDTSLEFLWTYSARGNELAKNLLLQLEEEWD